jgi:phospholipase D3/4
MTQRETPRKRRAYLVESIPTGMDELRTPGVPLTGPTLLRLVQRARKTIDLTAMYWTLTPNPARRDESGFTVEEMLEEYGAREGQRLYEALGRAAARGVRIRIVNGPGFDPTGDESGDLAAAHPDRISIREARMPDWYGSGIMHQKIWIVDGRDVYLGSANNDWKSLTQVKEMGICVEGDPWVAEEVTRYFDAWWAFTDPSLARRPVEVLDPSVGVLRSVPPWSELVPTSRRGKNPIARKALHARATWEKPAPFGVRGHFFLSGAPRELCVGGRTYDEDALVRTIQDAEDTVCISVMDFAPVSLYRGSWDRDLHRYTVDGKVASPIWWPPLVEALLAAVTTRCIHVRLLVSKWAHSSPFLAPYLRALRSMAEAAKASPTMRAGTLEVRRFLVPGWDGHADPLAAQAPGAPQEPRYPGHTRVNHTKYIVTDRRLNIGTSNMTYDYFGSTAGASFNTDDPGLVKKLQQVFDRDWASPYAVPLDV